MEKFLLAAEVANKQTCNCILTDVEWLSIWVIMPFTDKVGLTLRYSEAEITSWSTVLTNEKITLSPSYVLMITFLVLLEYSTYDVEMLPRKATNDLFAVELIYTF